MTTINVLVFLFFYFFYYASLYVYSIVFGYIFCGIYHNQRKYLTYIVLIVVKYYNRI